MSDDPGLELAKKGIEEAAETAREFLRKLVSDPLTELGGLMTDNIKLWRFKNQVNIILEAQRFLKEKDIEPTTVVPKTLIPLLESGSLEGEPSLQKKWSAMLANAAAPDGEKKVKPSYVQILKELSTLEVQILDQMYANAMSNPENNKTMISFSKEKICAITHISPEEFDVIADNLFRLQLCQPPASHGGVMIGEYPIVLRTNVMIHLTALGISFVQACKFD